MTASDDHDAHPPAVRAELIEAHRRAWARLAAPGTWWSGAERVAIAAETRRAPHCRLCRERAGALSPVAVEGEHERASDLPDAAVEAVHRIRTDASRLTEGWYRGLLADGLDDTRYVELVGVVACVLAVDRFRRALGLPPHPLPEAAPGEPSRHRPAGAREGFAWVPTVAPEDVGDDMPDIYADKTGASIHRALSLVPEAMLAFFDLDDVHYLADRWLRDFDREPRAISHAQIELLAARVSALNHCVY